MNASLCGSSWDPQNLTFYLCVLETSSFHLCIVFPGMNIDLKRFFELVKNWGAGGPKSKKLFPDITLASWVIEICVDVMHARVRLCDL